MVVDLRVAVAVQWKLLLTPPRKLRGYVCCLRLVRKVERSQPSRGGTCVLLFALDGDGSGCPASLKR